MRTGENTGSKFLYNSAATKNEMMSLAGKWMELKIIRLNEVSQAQKSKY
jgi:hypothetical protein